MPDRTQIGPTVDAEVWQQFREDVKARKGTVRGNLGTELDRALREYLSDSPRPVEREINARLQRLEAAAGITDADGGVDISEPSEHTHAPRAVPDEKPAANAATEKKTAWLAAAFVSEYGAGDGSPPDQIPTAKVREFVKDAYGFRKDTAKRYVDAVIDRHGYVDHPDADGVLQLPEVREEYLAEQREDATEDSETTMDQLERAEREGL